MKLRASILRLSALVLLCGCGGGYQGGGTPGGTGGVTSPSPGPNSVGNWQFSATSKVQGAPPPLTFAGSISLTGSAASGAVHVNGSNCFDPLSTVALTGTLTGSNLSLTSTPFAGQVATLTGNISDNLLTGLGQFTGSYAIQGGCAGGETGSVTGTEIPSLAGNWAGDLTSETGDVNRLVVTLAQGAPTSEGGFRLTGTAFFEAGTCFKSAKIVSGTFPSGSYVMGESVSLEIATDNGVIVFLGKANGDGLIRGSYTLAGSTCEPSGTAYLSPWEY